MRTKFSLQAQQISISGNNTLSLPRATIHDAYILKFNIHVANNATGATTKTLTITELLKCIEDIRLVTDSVRVHYAINGYDLALLNARLQKYGSIDSRVLSIADVTLAANATHDYEFVLYLDEGDIVALAHNQIDLTILFKSQTPTTKVNITAATCTVTLKEHICSSDEMIALYGKNLEKVVEPKVYGTTYENIAAMSEFNAVCDVPTGTLLRGCMLVFEPNTSSSQQQPEQVGILRKVPDRVELEKEDYASHRALDEIIYQTKFPDGVVNYDFSNQWQDNGVGKDGWSFARGDIVIAAKTPTAIASMRYISLESLVNIQYFQQTYPFTEY